MTKLRTWRDRRGRHHYEFVDGCETHAWDCDAPLSREEVDQRVARLIAPAPPQLAAATAAVDGAASPSTGSGGASAATERDPADWPDEPWPELVAPIDLGRPLPRIVGVMCQGRPGGGAERSLELSLSGFEPGVAGCVWTYETDELPSWHVPEVRMAQLGRSELSRLLEASVLVDDGAAEVPRLAPWITSYVQVARNLGGAVREAFAAEHDGPRVLTSRRTEEVLGECLRPGDAVIYNGVPAPTDCPWGGASSTAIVCGRLSPSKAVDELLGARPRGREVIVVGDGPRRAELERRFPQATFLGFRYPDPLYRRAGLALCRTRVDEAYWRVPFEAMGCGLPVVANRAGDLTYMSERAYLRAETPADVRAAWERLADPAERARQGAAGWRVAWAFHDEQVARWRWAWFLARLAGLEAYAPPPLLVGVTYAGGRPHHLYRCLEALERQIHRGRVVVLDDVTAHHDRALGSRLKAKFPWVEYEPVRYERPAESQQTQGNVSIVRNRLLDLLGDEAGLVWIDGDCLVPEDGLERVAAAVAAEPRMLGLFGRQRVEPPARLPEHLLETNMLRDLSLVDEPRNYLRRGPLGLSEILAEWGPTAPLWLGTGPAFACGADVARRWPEDWWGWGGEDSAWPYEMLTVGGAVPKWCCTVFHQEHEPAAEAMDREGRFEVIRAKLRQVYGV